MVQIVPSLRLVPGQGPPPPAAMEIQMPVSPSCSLNSVGVKAISPPGRMDLLAHWTSLHAEQEALADENQRLQRRVKRAKDYAESKLSRTSSENALLDSANSELRDKINRAKARAERKLQKAQAENETLENSNSDLRDQIAAAKDRAQRKLSRKQEDNNVLRKCNSDLQLQRDAAKSRVTAKFKQAQTENIVLDMSNDNLRYIRDQARKLERLRESLSSRKNDIAQDAFERKRHHWQLQRAALRREVAKATMFVGTSQRPPRPAPGSALSSPMGSVHSSMSSLRDYDYRDPSCSVHSSMSSLRSGDHKENQLHPARLRARTSSSASSAQ